MKTATERKGATKLADIPEVIKEQLNKGEIASVNLMEGLAVDHTELVTNVLTACNQRNTLQAACRCLIT